MGSIPKGGLAVVNNLIKTKIKKPMKKHLTKATQWLLNTSRRLIVQCIKLAFNLTLGWPFQAFNHAMKQLNYHYRKDSIYILIILNMIIFNTLFNIGCDFKEQVKMQPVQAKTITQQESTIKRLDEKVYGYNERVPENIIRFEIATQAEKFGLDTATMLDLAQCESGFNNLAKNPNGTATGVYQFTIATWHETPSWKNHRIAPTDYKANIREAMIDISNGEEWRWECWKMIK